MLLHLLALLLQKLVKLHLSEVGRLLEHGGQLFVRSLEALENLQLLRERVLHDARRLHSQTLVAVALEFVVLLQLGDLEAQLLVDELELLNLVEVLDRDGVALH